MGDKCSLGHLNLDIDLLSVEHPLWIYLSFVLLPANILRCGNSRWYSSQAYPGFPGGIVKFSVKDLVINDYMESCALQAQPVTHIASNSSLRAQ